MTDDADDSWRRGALAAIDHWHFLRRLQSARDLSPPSGRERRYVDRLDVDALAAADEVWAALTLSGPIDLGDGRTVSAPPQPPSRFLCEMLAPGRDTGDDEREGS